MHKKSVVRAELMFFALAPLLFFNVPVAVAVVVS